VALIFWDWDDRAVVTSHTKEDRVMTTSHAITPKGHSVAAGEGERIWIVGDTMTIKATAESTGGSLMLLENLTAPGGGPPPHIHTREDEFWYVLEGRFEIRIGDEAHVLGPGGFAYAPRGTVHNFRNTVETPSRILVGFTPGGMEGFFRQSGRPAADDGPAPPVDESEIARTMAAAPEYGVEAVAFED
jgi:mannose-6-phosphate isomerase-like protein (cupin superfamily)